MQIPWRQVALTLVSILVLAAVGRAQSDEDRIGRLERLLEDQKRNYESELSGLRRRLSELEGRDSESELDAILSDMEEEADAALASGVTPTAGESFLSGQSLLNAFNPRITLFGDFVGRLDNRAVRHAHSHSHDEAHEEHEEHEGEEHEEEEDHDEAEEHEDDSPRVDDRASLRSIELDFRADIDPFAKAVAILALHEEEPGSYHVDPEEVYLTLETLPWGLRAKGGKFKASFGMVNQLHPHDYQQSTTPLVLEDWFGHEGLVGQGAELSWLIPQDFVDSLVLTGGVFSGEMDVLAGSESQDPAWLGRLQLFETLSDASYFQIGTSHLLGFTDRGGRNKARVSAVDVLYRWRPPHDSLNTSFFAQAEGFYGRRETEHGTTKSLGGFVTLQYQPMRDLYLGARLDYVRPLEDAEYEKMWAGGVWASWYTSEFLRFRVGYEHRGIRGMEDLDTLFFQVTWVFGSHPVEPYWFNK